MKHVSTISKIARRGAAVIAAAGLIAVTSAFAASAPGAALAADTTPGAARAAAAVPACTAGDLGVWVALTQGNGAAGTIFYPLQFTNLSRHACAGSPASRPWTATGTSSAARRPGAV